MNSHLREKVIGMPQGLSQTAPSEVEKARERYYAQQQGMRDVKPPDEPVPPNYCLNIIEENYKRISEILTSLEKLRERLCMITEPRLPQEPAIKSTSEDIHPSASKLERKLAEQTSQLIFLHREVIELTESIRL